MDADYSRQGGDKFIVSSANFGRAYLSDGWATRSMQSLPARFQIAFTGYGADDPLGQYPLEAFNFRAGNRSRLLAFQRGGNADDAAPGSTRRASDLWQQPGQ